MSTSVVPVTSLNPQLAQFVQTRQSDLRQLGQALGSGDLAGAQTAYNNIVSLGQGGPFAGGVPFKVAQREQDFTAIGQALQSGDLAGAQQAFSTFQAQSAAGRRDIPQTGPVSNPGPEIVLNLSNSSSNATPEQITINISNPTSGGGEQVSLSVGDQGSSSPQQITFNLSPNSNEQIVLNLLGESSSTSSSSSNSGSSSSTGLSVSA